MNLDIPVPPRIRGAFRAYRRAILLSTNDPFRLKDSQMIGSARGIYSNSRYDLDVVERDSAIHAAIHIDYAYGVLPMTYSAVRALLSRRRSRRRVSSLPPNCAL